MNRPTNEPPFDWQVESEAAALLQQLIEPFVDQLPVVKRLSQRMLAETGTRLVDWVDHLAVPSDSQLAETLAAAGFTSGNSADEIRWTHAGGIFPTVRFLSANDRRIAIKVDSVVDFLAANQIDSPIAGRPLAPLRTALVADCCGYQLWVIERHGCNRFEPPDMTDQKMAESMQHAEAFVMRRRDFEDPRDGFQHASDLIANAESDLGVDWACDLFFASERRYWQSRNHAARVQKRRQDILGLGWANHDHHTYRSSRQHFTRLIELLEQLGFVCRERFYGGAQAGWGAQVLEQSATGIVIFADVDMTPHEVAGDFPHTGLEPRGELGTVGLWCALHGEAILQAGLHHLECQFDFDAARDSLAHQGIDTMAPFTDFPHLKQAFTKAEVWPIDSRRIDRALTAGLITAQQASEFLARGSLGSHLEILERNGGFKGFNQSGISDIILETDPRRTPHDL